MPPNVHALLMQVHAFVAPKIIGGKNAPSPVGELGMVEMTQALELIDVSYEQVGINYKMYIFKIKVKLLMMVCALTNKYLTKTADRIGCAY